MQPKTRPTALRTTSESAPKPAEIRIASAKRNPERRQKTALALQWLSRSGMRLQSFKKNKKGRAHFRTTKQSGVASLQIAAVTTGYMCIYTAKLYIYMICCTVCSMYHILHSLIYTLRLFYIIYYTLYTMISYIYHALYTIHDMPYTIYYILYTAYYNV